MRQKRSARYWHACLTCDTETPTRLQSACSSPLQSPFGTGVKPCLHIRPATLQTLISQYTLLNTLYQLKRLAAAVQSAFAATLEEHAVHLRVKAAEIHASVSSACCYVGWQGVPQHTRSQSPGFLVYMLQLAKKRRTVQGDRQQRAAVLSTHRARAAWHCPGQQLLHCSCAEVVYWQPSRSWRVQWFCCASGGLKLASNS